MNNFNTVAEVVEANMKGAVTKGTLPLWKMIILGIFAGMFIGFGGEASNLAVHDLSNVGLARTLAALIFPVGLMMIVVVCGELFTGNCLMIMGTLDGRVKVTQLLKNLFVVYFANMIGSVLVAAAINMCGQLDYSSGLLGAYTIKVAMGKCAMSFDKALISGICCNVLVCVAVLAAGAAKDIVGKLFSCFFIICVFVVSGFEHCVANMFYLPAGIMAAGNEKYVQVAMDTYGLTADQIAQVSIGGMVHNLIPVTIGNIIGGMVVVGVALYYMYGKKTEAK